MSNPAPTVAVIGLGALGLVALKNLLEEGYDAIAYEKKPYIGGIWQYNDGSDTSVLKSTIVNISKQRGCFTDFPFRDDVESLPNAKEVAAYLVEYASHFNLYDKMKLNTTVHGIKRVEEMQKWCLELSGSGDESKEPKLLYYDKVIVATGPNAVANYPKVKDIELFKGRVLHSQEYKRPTDFDGKRVLVLGFSNSAADTATTLVGHAKAIYLSHRHGNFVMPRKVNGKPADHSISYRITTMMEFFMKYFPRIGEIIFEHAFVKMQNSSFELQPNWRFTPVAPAAQSIPIVSEDLVGELRAGTIISVSGIKQIRGDHNVELDDGTQLADIDCIIYCTGYDFDTSIVGEYDPSRHVNQKWLSSAGSNGRPFPWLYQNVISLDYPDSLAFMGTTAFLSPAFVVYDLASMAIAQIWKGNAKLPSKEEMNRQADEHFRWIQYLASRGTVHPSRVKSYEWMEWANEAACTGVPEKLGYGLSGWWFWLRNYKFCNLLMGGIYSPHIYRLFTTRRRKAWEGAREAIIKANSV
ncbi:hypothetical protein LOZ58_000377 [Ophidiomyces ophidiicola]|nr:hypothetical protein LOZ65_000303 [Ophidiomyces ophidiicola]KAI1935020.1 hypothetical protein LOZ66_005569 [Ophidiomyces ophidiicola]KAI1966887.1 hypothetical protein LOZ58_000377 [Ophidiomyces ophidiicola]